MLLDSHITLGQTHPQKQYFREIEKGVPVKTICFALIVLCATSTVISQDTKKSIDTPATIDSLEKELVSDASRTIRDNFHRELQTLEDAYEKKRQSLYKQYREDLKQAINVAVDRDDSDEMKSIANLVLLLESGAPQVQAVNVDTIENLKDQVAALKSKDRIVAIWKHSWNQGNKSGTSVIAFSENGSIITDMEGAKSPTWRVKGESLVMTWPGYKDINKCILSNKGDRYFCTTENKATISGELLWSVKQWPMSPTK